jgi:phosphate transport system protein
MVLEFFRSPRDSGLDHIEQMVATMIADCRHTFDAAMNALVGGTDPAAVADDIRSTDQRINEAEREIRRELVVHASVHGSGDVSTILAYMLVSRMLERIGDNAKNVFDLAEEGVGLADGDDAELFRSHRDEISELFSTTGTILAARDSDGASEQLNRVAELLRGFDEEVRTQLHSKGMAEAAVPRALLARYLKRIVANLGNIMSSVVLPVDKMDYYGSELDAANEDT